MPTVLILAALAALAYALAALGLVRRLQAGGSAHGALWPLLLAANGVVLQLGLHAWAGHLRGAPDLHFFAALSLVARTLDCAVAAPCSI